MVEISKLVDKESLEVWFDSQALKVSITIEFRTLMRKMPIYFTWSSHPGNEEEFEAAVLLILKLSTIANAVINSSGEEIPDNLAKIATGANSNKMEALYSARFSSAVAEFGHYFDNPPENLSSSRNHTGIDSLELKSLTYDTIAITSVVFSFMINKMIQVPTPKYSLNDVGDLLSSHMILLLHHGKSLSENFKIVQKECRIIESGDDLNRVGLWLDFESTEEELWRLAKEYFEEEGSKWAYWIRWYESLLSGEQLKLEMIDRIAGIGSEEWAKGAQHIANLIAEIELEFAISGTPNSEKIVLTEQNKYQAIPQSELPAKTLSDARERIEDVISTIRAAQGNNNQYSPLVKEADMLEDCVERYGDNAIRLHEGCTKVVNHVVTYVGEGSLPERDNVVMDVSNDLLNTADDIYSFDADAKKTIDAREKRRFSRLTDEEKAISKPLAEEVAKLSVEMLGPEMIEDAEAFGEGQEPTEDQKFNRYRFGSRLARIAILGGPNLGKILSGLGLGAGGALPVIEFIKLIAPFFGF